ncbi:MAG: hypothetical protein M0P31_18700, partial [Solirubrobacteraceae bacterium]|nr:hypothetical protein [Solirubrobacteraceae bacterium]
MSEALGDTLATVGAALVPGERRPRPQRLVLPVAGSYDEIDHRAAGLRLRRQVRQLMENPAWKQHGLYFELGWDPESAVWLMVGSGELADNEMGVWAGDWTLTLDDAYVVGRPGTHRRGRRIAVSDRASGTVPTDTRGVAYSTALSVLTSKPRAFVPGDLTALTGAGGLLRGANTGPVVAGRMLWRTIGDVVGTATDGEVVSWVADRAVLPDPSEREQLVEDPGQVRVWSVPDGDVGLLENLAPNPVAATSTSGTAASASAGMTSVGVTR